MKLLSTAFKHGGKIPSKYTCDGKNISPPLEILAAPKNVKSLALIMEDPDVPKHIRKDGMWDHWVVFNIKPDIKEIAEGNEPGGVQGMTTSGKLGYGGPCPPDREHRYFFKLFALDTELDLEEGSTKKEVLDAIEGHIVEEAVLMGRYERLR
ncbi:MAG: YbhB/YbcL family Raf kinase inhibitor-like protein [Nanoarchaeota archaeon]